MRKFIITAELRDITDRWDNPNREDSISYSKMVELLNEKALKYAQEYADSKLLSVDRFLNSELEIIRNKEVKNSIDELLDAEKMDYLLTIKKMLIPKQ